MCKPFMAKRPTAPTAYEGETVRFETGTQTITSARHCTTGWFPWWTLWLIWPTIGVIKAVAPLAIGTWTTIAQMTVPLVPVLLVLVGLWLLRRR